MTSPPTLPADPAQLASLLRRQIRATGADRLILGLVGGPGAGKSTLASALVTELAREGENAVVVPMDGFHLAQAVLAELGLTEVKGAPATFDAEGYLALLRRLRDHSEATVYAPTFTRSIEEPIAGAIAIERSARYVITEGNYLLLADEPWPQVRALLDAAWFVDVSDDIRVNRLVRRHIQFGRSPVDSLRRATSGSDADNAQLIAATRERADLIVLT